jgi:hypothetical protein|tara:strand:+ start:249 stop:407 length:159 start_codon:yes stop_codon:yes gene_type:complete
MSKDKNARNRGRFCFVISLQNAKDAKVSDWSTVEAVLQKTVESLLALTQATI